MDPNIHIRSFEPGDASAFRELNERWIVEHFELERADIEALSHPYSHYIEPGGAILMVVDGDSTVGCCALVAAGNGVYEVSKMTIREDYRGKGIGKALLLAIIDAARNKGASLVYLVMSDKLQTAVRLYEAVGFRHVPREQLPPSHYERSNVFMAMRP